MGRIQITDPLEEKDLEWLFKERIRMMKKGVHCDIYKIKIGFKNIYKDGYLLIAIDPNIPEDRMSSGIYIKSMKLLAIKEIEFNVTIKPGINKDDRNVIQDCFESLGYIYLHGNTYQDNRKTDIVFVRR